MKKNLFFTIISFLVLSLNASFVFAFTEVVDPQNLSQRLGELRPTKDLSDIKVAILDNSFAGFEAGNGMLPDSAELIEGPLKYPSNSSHGLGMAQILWAMTGNSSTNAPKMYLINTSGFTNLKSAVDFVIKNKIDIVLYSQIWLFGSNFDGKGFINEVVNKATSQGVIWINAAGNLGGHTYSGKVDVPSQSFKIKNKFDENSFTITLAWNDFADNELVCATKDLDLELVNAAQEVVLSSSLIQAGKSPDDKDPKDHHSCYARETISVSSLERGDYEVRVVRKSTNFGVKDNFKVIINDERPDSMEFPGHTVGFEIMPPADNANVITVGDKTDLSSKGPTADGRIKPDFIVEDSKVAFTNGNLTQGSSNAAAMVAGQVVILKSMQSGLMTDGLLRLAQNLREQYFIPNGLITPTSVPTWMMNYVPAGGVIRLHPVTGRAIIFSKEAPLSLSILNGFNLHLIQSDDLVICHESLTRCGIYPRTQDSLIAPPYLEFRQFIKGADNSSPGIWKNISF